MNSLTIVFCFAIVIVGSLLLNLYLHEKAHVQINKYFGTASHIEFTLDGGQTVFDSNFVTKEDRQAAYLVHGVNEAVTYSLTPLFTGLMICLLLIGLIIKNK